MTAAADSPRPWKAEPIADEADIYWLKSPDGTIIGSSNQQGLKLVRAVNSYAKMWEALEKVSALRLADANGGKENWLNSRFEGAEAVQFVRTILKEIDNG